MSKSRIWEAKEFDYDKEFSIYLRVSMTEDYSPQEVTKDLKEFRKYLREKHINKNKVSFWDKFKLK